MLSEFKTFIMRGNVVDRPIGGIKTSLTSEVTMAPKLAPMITPTARSTTLPRMMNVLNALNMGRSSYPRYCLRKSSVRVHASVALGS